VRPLRKTWKLSLIIIWGNGIIQSFQKWKL